MKPLDNILGSGGDFTTAPSASSLAALTLVLGLVFITTAQSATNIVTSLADSGVGSLSQVIAESAAGDSIVFGVSGTIPLAGELAINQNLAIIGPGSAVLTISGQGATGIFCINSSVTVLISGLMISNGRTPDQAEGSGGAGAPGGAIINNGSLTLLNCVVTSSRSGSGGSGYSPPFQFPPVAAPGPGGSGGDGGAIWNSGTLSVSNCVISDNATGSGGAGGCNGDWSDPNGSAGRGGGIFSLGTLNLADSVVSGNGTGIGGGVVPLESGGGGGDGGGVWNGGQCTAIRCIFAGNRTGPGGEGGAGNPANVGCGGGGGWGAGIFDQNGLALTDCTVSNNFCGNGGAGGGSSVEPPGSGGSGGSGGGVYTVNGVIVGSTIVGNGAGTGGPGGTELPGGFYGNGSAGPQGEGGGILSDGQLLLLTNCTVAGNVAGSGGGLSLYGATQAVVACTIVHNSAGGESSRAGGVATEVKAPSFLDTLIALNTALDVAGTFNSLGHNLVGATNGGSGFSATGDLTGTTASPLDPGVAPLAYNGGPTLTVALLRGSPAIGAGAAPGAPSTDQRGFPRPAGAVDVGACEYGYPPVLQTVRPAGGATDISISGRPGQAWRLFASPDLASWTPIATNYFDANGAMFFHDARGVGQKERFYRASMP
jgi:hypothetical protein